MSAATGRRELRRDWLAKTLAGLLLGFTLAVGASGLLGLALGGVAAPARSQLMMWAVMPVWLGVFSGVYFFASGLRAWLWLVAANTLVFGALALARAS